MNARTTQPHTDAPAHITWWPRVVAAFGLTVATLLAYRTWTADPLPGCGGASGCAELLAGRWAYWLSPHLPVAAMGLLTWIAINVAAWLRSARPWLMPLAVLAAGAAVWFIVVQAVFARQWCPYCLAAHAAAFVLLIGLLIQRAPMRLAVNALSLLAVALLVAGQLFAPVHPDEIIAAKTDPNEPLAVTPRATSTDTQNKTNTDTVADTDTNKNTDTTPEPTSAYADFPRLGPADAPHTLVSFFDYTCRHCHQMHALIDAAREQHADRLAVVLVIAPLNEFCNPRVNYTAPDHRDACRLARMALAVWRADPSRFPEMHDFLMNAPGPTPHQPADARVFAVSLVGEDAFVAALADPITGDLIERGAELNFETGQALDPPADNVLPKTVLPDGRVVLRLPRSRDAFLQVLADAMNTSLRNRRNNTPPDTPAPPSP